MVLIDDMQMVGEENFPQERNQQRPRSIARAQRAALPGWGIGMTKLENEVKTKRVRCRNFFMSPKRIITWHDPYAQTRLMTFGFHLDLE